MKRFIVIECNDKMSTMFVAVHEGEAVCMTPLLVDSVTEQCKQAVKAVPVDNLVAPPLDKRELLTVLEQYIFHEAWFGERDWQGERVHPEVTHA
jgi:hypothetical protein